MKHVLIVIKIQQLCTFFFTSLVEWLSIRKARVDNKKQWILNLSKMITAETVIVLHILRSWLCSATSQHLNPVIWSTCKRVWLWAQHAYSCESSGLCWSMLNPSLWSWIPFSSMRLSISSQWDQSSCEITFWGCPTSWKAGTLSKAICLTILQLYLINGGPQMALQGTSEAFLAQHRVEKLVIQSNILWKY